MRLYTKFVVVVLNAAVKKSETTSPNVKYFTTEFDIDDVNDQAQYVVSLRLQTSSDEIIITSSFEIRTLVPANCTFV